VTAPGTTRLFRATGRSPVDLPAGRQAWPGGDDVEVDPTHPLVGAAVARGVGALVPLPDMPAAVPVAPVEAATGAAVPAAVPGVKSDDEILAMTVGDVGHYVGAHPAELARVIALEQTRDQPRSTVLRLAPA